MYRTILEELLVWKESVNPKPLIIMGARQVGKTYIIREFAKENYKDAVEINFQNDVKAREYFKSCRSDEQIMNYLQINNLNLDFTKNPVLVFFDEIQCVPELISELKFLGNQKNCHFICSGSMLGVSINRTSSFPVGYIEMKTMYPMTFYEFLLAAGMKQKYIDEVCECIKNRVPVELALHEKFEELFNTYTICGGLPEVVETYFTSNSIFKAIEVLRRLHRDYKNDIAVYGTNDIRIKALECYESLPLQLAKDNKKFQYKLVRDGYNARYFESSLKWLEMSGIVYKVNRIKEIGDPLALYKEIAIFKIYSFDTGLLVSSFDDEVVAQIYEDTLGVYKGVIYENVCNQIMHSYGIENYYYEPNSSAEIDFVIRYGGKNVPVEVKGGRNTRSTSFNDFIIKHNSQLALRFSKKNVGYDEKLNTYYLPLYSLDLVLKYHLI